MRSPPNYEEKENLENLKITIDSILNCGKRRFRVSDLVKASKMITTVSRFAPHLTYLVKKGYLTVEKTHKGSWYYVDELDKLRMIGGLELPNHDKKFLEKMKDTIESILYYVDHGRMYVRSRHLPRVPGMTTKDACFFSPYLRRLTEEGYLTVERACRGCKYRVLDPERLRNYRKKIEDYLDLYSLYG